MISVNCRNNLKNLILKFPIPSGNIFCFLFNLITFFFKGSDFISYQDNYYHIKKKNWKFYYKKQGAYAYLAGLEKRSEDLKKAYLIENINFYDNDLIIDCGANNGDFNLCFKKKIKYVGIEPSPIVYETLKHNVGKQITYNKALWKSSDEILDFYLKDEGGDSSIIPIKDCKKISISTITLDQIIENSNSHVKLIKIEAEGSEPEVLEGLRLYSEKVSYITIDVSFERGEDSKSTLIECSNLFFEKNFRLLNFAIHKSRLTIIAKNKLKDKNI